MRQGKLPLCLVILMAQGRRKSENTFILSPTTMRGYSLNPFQHSMAKTMAQKRTPTRVENLADEF